MRLNLSKSTARGFSFFFLLAFAVGCSKILVPTSSISGVVQLARVSGATIKVFEMLEDGTKGELLTETTTNVNGEYTVSISKSISHVIIESVGGTYLDEASAQEKTAATLTAMVEAGAVSNAPVTPMSSLVKDRTVALLATSSSLTEAKAQALSEVAGIFGVTPGDIEAIPTAPNAMASSNMSATRAALGLAAFSYMMKDFQYGGETVSLEDALEALAEDIKDDGKANGSISGALAKKLAFEWKTALAAGRIQAAANSNLVFSKISSEILSEVSSTAIDTGSSLEGLQEDGSFYVNGVNTGLLNGNGVFLDKLYNNGLIRGTYNSATNTININWSDYTACEDILYAGCSDLAITYTGDAHVHLSGPNHSSTNLNISTTGNVQVGTVKNAGSIQAANVTFGLDCYNLASIHATGDVVFSDYGTINDGSVVASNISFLTEFSLNHGTATATNSITFSSGAYNTGTATAPTINYNGFTGGNDSGYFIGGQKIGNFDNATQTVTVTIDRYGSEVLGFYDFGGLSSNVSWSFSQSGAMVRGLSSSSGSITISDGGTGPVGAYYYVLGREVGTYNAATSTVTFHADVTISSGYTGNLNFVFQSGTYFGGMINTTGTVTFAGGSALEDSGEITANVIFNAFSFNNGTVIGTATFNDSSENRWNVEGAATFNGVSLNYGTVSGQCFLNGESSNQGACGSISIPGTRVFGTSFYANGNDVGTYDSDSNTITITGILSSDFNYDAGDKNITFSSANFPLGATLTTTGTVEFGGNNHNYGTLNAFLVIFTGTARNWGTINGAVNFNDSSFNQGATINGNVTFNDSSYNMAGATVNGNITLNDSAANNGAVTGSVTDNRIAACAHDCYLEGWPSGAQGLSVGTLRLGPGGAVMILEYANGSSGFKVWRERDGNRRLLNATGLVANGWQQILTRAGTGFDGNLTNSSVVAQIEGRTCPPNVFLNHDQMLGTNRCLYYDSGNSLQQLQAAEATGTEAIDWLKDSASEYTFGNSGSYYEGNIKTCADKGMRLPTLYETTAENPGDDFRSDGDGLGFDPVFAGPPYGVPAVSSEGDEYTWTASAPRNSMDYYCFDVWDENNYSTCAMTQSPDVVPTYGTALVRCVLPSH